MGTSLLQEFLNLRLLDIGAEDARLDKLDSTCVELALSYATNPQNALPPLLAAWDPNAEADPALLEIATVLQGHWPTFRGAFSDEPLTLYRAVVLESVMRAMELQSSLAVAVSLVAANVLPQLKVGQETPILKILVGRAEALTSVQLEQAWPQQDGAVTNRASMAVPPMNSLKKIDESTWFAQVAATAGPSSNKSGLTLNNPNPHWTNQTGGWSYEFADRMAPVLADVHDKAAGSALRVAGTAFKALADAVAAKLNEFVEAEQARANQREAASRLLWWRQSLYSETAKKPYRKLPAALVVWHMALDISDLLPEVYPRAVESLLFESVLAVTEAQGDVELTLKELLQVDGATSQLAQLQWLMEQRTSASRTLLIQALANSYAARNPELAKLGVDTELKMPPGDWAIWLLREIKALETLASPGAVKQEAEAA
ncbi:hypothetical protein KW830_01990 [Comamonas sp. CMM03]|uniref:GTPase-associated system all-helical protein GASH n=1 Tax=Comamonas sp. CMM03 TaxID=2854781 RepID=UPI001C46A8AB|nr:GTPase-associated system all-helical protein GASH [Comamonas sp. CMM03]MBV7417221.1 hypothetical protein [Comamonas sp. CMM03]